MAEDFEGELEDEFFASLLAPLISQNNTTTTSASSGNNNVQQSQMQTDFISPTSASNINPFGDPTTSITQTPQATQMQQPQQIQTTQIPQQNAFTFGAPQPVYFQQPAPQQYMMQEAQKQFVAIANNSYFKNNNGMRPEQVTSVWPTLAQEVQMIPQPVANITFASASPPTPTAYFTTSAPTVYSFGAMPAQTPIQPANVMPRPAPTVYSQGGFYQPQQPAPQPVLYHLAQQQQQQQQYQNLIRLVEGFNKPLEERVIGGRDNVKQALPRQVVELNVAAVPSTIPVSTLTVKCYICGYNRTRNSSNSNKILLSELAEKKFDEKKDEQLSLTRYVAIFDSLICKYASHNNGSKLSLRFYLCDMNKNRVCYVDSEEFETITKRGIDKAKKRKREDSESTTMIDDVVPPIGIVTGRELVKIIGNGLVCPPGAQPSVFFGSKQVPEIHSIKRNIIICETPAAEKPGEVEVKVSFDKTNFVQSNAKFLYVDTSEPEGIQEMVKYLMKKQQNQQGKPPSSNSSSASSSPMPTSPYSEGGSTPVATLSLASFANGTQVDLCGFTVLHHAAAHGYFELTYLLLQRGLNVSAKDNYGRTPLFWAAWEGCVETAAGLYTYGASLSELDEMEDSFLHIAVRQNNFDFIKEFSFWLLQFDDQYRTNASAVQKLIDQKNQNNETPLMEAEQLSSKDESFRQTVQLLKALKSICKKRISEKTIQLRDIKLRSGVHNGKTLTELEGKNINCTLSLENEKFSIHIEKQQELQVPARNITAEIPLEILAFIIFDMSKDRVEVTLKKEPTIYIIGSAVHLSIQPSILSSCLSFHLDLTNKEDVQKLHETISQSPLLVQFRPHCFCFKPSITERVPEKQEPKVKERHTKHLVKDLKVNTKLLTTKQQQTQQVVQSPTTLIQ